MEQVTVEPVSGLTVLLNASGDQGGTMPMRLARALRRRHFGLLLVFGQASRRGRRKFR